MFFWRDMIKFKLSINKILRRSLNTIQLINNKDFIVHTKIYVHFEETTDLYIYYITSVSL